MIARDFQGNIVHRFKSQSDAKREGFRQATISRCIRGRSKFHCGLTFEEAMFSETGEIVAKEWWPQDQIKAEPIAREAIVRASEKVTRDAMTIHERYMKLVAADKMSLNGAAILTLAAEMRDFRIEQQETNRLFAEILSRLNTVEPPAPAVEEEIEEEHVVSLANLPEYLTPVDIAARLGVSQPTAYHLLNTGQIPHHRVGGGRGRVRVTARDFKTYVQEGKEAKPAA